MELVKFSSALILPISAILLAFFYTTVEAVGVTAWTNPTITGATGSGTANPSIAEDKAAGASTGVTIAATLTGTATYAILSQPTSDKISIGTSSGILSLKSGKTFDYETETTYVLVITCTDSAGGDIGTATVTLSITNVNEAPVFASELYSAVLSDGATAGTAAVTVSATDVDASTTLTYTITDGNTGNDLAIGASSGAITVATGKTLKKSTTAGYSLTVTVSDGTLSDTTSVLVVVQTCSSATTALASVMTMLLAAIAHKL